MSAEDEKTTPRLPVSTPVWFKIFLTDGFQSLVNEVHEIKEVSESNNRALRGQNGEPGLLTRFEVLEKKVDGVFSFGAKIFLFAITSVLGVIIYEILTSR